MTTTERWIIIAVGVWLIISPWILGFSDEVLVKWSSVLCGIILVVMNVWVLSAEIGTLKK
jgi:hypothetical protein